jgi:hypothetical protein
LLKIATASLIHVPDPLPIAIGCGLCRWNAIAPWLRSIEVKRDAYIIGFPYRPKSIIVD